VIIQEAQSSALDAVVSLLARRAQVYGAAQYGKEKR
jgi:hypothetical protein